jgi:hypothetical protein
MQLSTHTRGTVRVAFAGGHNSGGTYVDAWAKIACCSRFRPQGRERLTVLCNPTCVDGGFSRCQLNYITTVQIHDFIDLFRNALEYLILNNSLPPSLWIPSADRASMDRNLDCKFFQLHPVYISWNGWEGM